MIPTPPTDNLYKFVTFLGIVVMLFCFWTISETQQKASSGINSYTYAAERLDEEKEYLEKFMLSLEVEVDDLRKKAEQASSENDINKDTINKIESQSRILNGKIKLARDQSENLSTIYKDVQSKSDIARDLADNLNSVFVLYSIGIGFGMLCFFWGVVSWYTLHQRFQDEILQLTARSLSLSQKEN